MPGAPRPREIYRERAQGKSASRATTVRKKGAPRPGRASPCRPTAGLLLRRLLASLVGRLNVRLRSRAAALRPSAGKALVHLDIGGGRAALRLFRALTVLLVALLGHYGGLLALMRRLDDGKLDFVIVAVGSL